MSTQIKEALLKLDPANNDHWTSEGVPRLDVMKELVGGDVNRADVTAACKSFTRKHPVIEEVSPDAEKTAPEAQSTEVKDPEETPEDETTPDVDDSDEDPELDDLEKSEAAIAESLDDAREVLVEAQQLFKRAQEAMDVVINARAKRDSRTTDAHTIQAFQKAQLKSRAQKAARKKRLDDLLG